MADARFLDVITLRNKWRAAARAVSHQAEPLGIHGMATFIGNIIPSVTGNETTFK